MTKLPRYDDIVTVDDWYNKRESRYSQRQRKNKTEGSSSSLAAEQTYSIFLGNDFRYKLLDEYPSLDKDSKLYKFLTNNSYLLKMILYLNP